MVASTTSSGPARWSAAAGALAIVAAAAIFGFLEFDAALGGASLTRRTISHHALADNGWAFDLAVILLAAGSLAVFGALRACGIVRGRSGASIGFGLWSVGLLLVALFTKHDWSVGPSASGYVHWAGTLIAFLSLPIAMILTGRRRWADPRWRGYARLSLMLGVVSLLWFLPIAGAIGLHITAGTPWWQVIPLGLIERLLAGTELLAVLSAAWWAVAASAAPAMDGFSQSDQVQPA